MDKRNQGDQGVATAILHYTRSGCIVSVPTTEASRYDLIIDRGGDLLRVQVKTTTRKHRNSQDYTVGLRTSGGESYPTKRGTQWLSADEVDVLFVLDGDGYVWEIPIADAAGRTELVLGRSHAECVVGQFPPLVSDAVTYRPEPARSTAHIRGAGRSNAKLTDELVREILAADPDESHSSLAAKYGVSHATISLVRRRETWRHVTP